ncbi:hypothetical protein [Streptomyces sp. SHP 1-2]|uniref:hypothetical protein n=1 Tax=Streptomyces sp. SHP 1-2 TaxID=2769489 RepID=UPI002238FA49|nr:hypothetical protein [Streptomyces sp. SHP 1-2]MCW5252014.1 hypothetical protein [Streptomyces sp. SHP 1-2]
MRRGYPLIATLGVLMAGCSGGAPASGGPEIDVPAPTAEAENITFPFDSYELSDNDIIKAYLASDVLIHSCMSKKGHEWKLIKARKNVPSWRNRLHFGVMELEVASRFGYHAPAELLSSPEYRRVVREMNRQLGELTKEGASDAASCRKEAGQALTRGAKTSFTKFNDLKSSTFDAAKRDREVKNAADRWSACMKAAGFDYATPWEAASRWGFEGSPVKLEVKTAVADVKCKKKADLVSIWLQAEKRLEEAEIKKDEPYFNGLLSANGRYLHNVQAVLSKE